MVALGKWRFYWWHEPVEESDELRRCESPLPVDWLLGLRERREGMAGMRNFLQRHSPVDILRLPDSAVVQQVKRGLETGRIKVYVWRIEKSGGDQEKDSRPPAPFPLGARSRSGSGSSQSGEDGLFPNDAEFSGIAGALQQASKDGVPFCEECARRREEQEALA